LQASGIPAKPVDGAKDLLSAMARGDALIKGAAQLSVPRRKGRSQNTRHYRLLQSPPSSVEAGDGLRGIQGVCKGLPAEVRKRQARYGRDANGEESYR
jgi:hypothetical protein